MQPAAPRIDPFASPEAPAPEARSASPASPALASPGWLAFLALLAPLAACGLGGSGIDPEQPPHTADHGFILLVPNGVNPATGSATGSSNGGMMSYRLAAEIPDHLAGIAAFIANAPAISECPEVGLGSVADEGEAVPLMMVNGTDDGFMPFEGGSIVGGRGMVRSSAETLDRWRRSNETSDEPFQTLDFPSLDPGDATAVSCRRFANAAGEERVRYCVVEGGGHITPSIDHPIPRWLERVLGPQNRDMESAREAWAFLEQFR